jgi:hypothetical protein
MLSASRLSARAGHATPPQLQARAQHDTGRRGPCCPCLIAWEPVRPPSPAAAPLPKKLTREVQEARAAKLRGVGPAQRVGRHQVQVVCARVGVTVAGSASA